MYYFFTEVDDDDSGEDKKDESSKKPKVEINIGSEHIKKVEVSAGRSDKYYIYTNDYILIAFSLIIYSIKFQF